MKTATATLMGFETMRMIRRGHYIQRKRQVTGEVRLVNQIFGFATQMTSSTAFVMPPFKLLQQCLVIAPSSPGAMRLVLPSWADVYSRDSYARGSFASSAPS
jgi:hypothetical protein